MGTFSDARRVFERVASDLVDKNVTFMAAGIAYNALVSLAPLVILLLFVVSAVGGGLEARLIDTATASLPGPIARVVTDIAAAETAVSGASVVGVIVLLWGTLKIFRGLDTAFSEIYETGAENSIRDQLVDAGVVFAVLVVAIVATAGITVLFSALSDTVPFLGLATPLVLIVGLVAAFLPMYRRFPDANLGWREALPGAVVGAVGWAALQGLFRVYLVFDGDGSGGFFGGVIVVITWLYFSGLVLLLGAVFNAVVGGHSTGQPGGVGAGVARRATRTELNESLERTELSSYLRDLRARVTGRYEELEPATDPPDSAARGSTDGAVATDTSTTSASANGGPPDAAGTAVLDGDPASSEASGRDADRLVREIEGTLRAYRPRTPEGKPAEVIERSRADGDERVHEVRITWRTPEP